MSIAVVRPFEEQEVERHPVPQEWRRKLGEHATELYRMIPLNRLREHHSVLTNDPDEVRARIYELFWLTDGAY